jgi:MFS family permease
VALGAIALYVVNKTLHIPNFTRVNHRLDWSGAAALTTTLVPILLVAQEGRIWGWTGSNSLICYAISTFGLVWFITAERKIGDEALLPLRLFKDKTFSTITFINVITGIGMFGGLAVLPLYLQIVGGATPTEAGLQLLPLTLGIMSGSVVSGQTISRIGRYKAFPIVGSILMTLSLAWMTQIAVDTEYWLIAVMSLIFGFGLGNLMQPTVLAVQNAVSPRDIGVATSSVTLFRQLGATIGTAVFLSLLFGRLPELVDEKFQTAFADPTYQAALANPDNAATAAKLQELQTLGAAGFDDTSWLASANQFLVRPILEGFSEATTLVFGVGALVTLVSIAFAFMIPNNRLRERDEAFTVSE